MEDLIPNSVNSTPLTPIGFLDRVSTVYGESPSIIYGDKIYTWSETHNRCLRLASSISSLLLQTRNQQGGGRTTTTTTRHVVSSLAPNIPALYELHFAVPMAGAILNNINTRLDPRTVSILLTHSSTSILFIDCLSLPLALQSLTLFPTNHPHPLLILIPDKHHPINHTTTSIHSNYDSLIETGDPSFNWIRPKTEWDPLVLNYTSGTTSSPKGVVHSHRGAFIVTLDSIIDWSLPKGAVYLWTLPMFHSNGWNFTWGLAAIGGVSVCLRKVDGPSVHDAIRRYGVTHMCGAPVVLNMLTNYPGVGRLERSVNVITAGAPPADTILMKAEEMGFVVSHGYGLTETGGIVVTCAWKPKWNRFPATKRARLKARQGVRTIAMTEMDVINPETGKSVTRDGQTTGEIVLRGACLMLGYLKDPAATAACMRGDGWFRTGDIGVMHPDGYLEIKDRSKDIIISGGENISSVEVETVLYSHPAVNEAAVVARPDQYWGETPCAFVSLKVGGLKPSEMEIVEYCRGRMPHYMVPKTVVIKDELPKTSTGKIQKFLLRKMAKEMGSVQEGSGLSRDTTGSVAVVGPSRM